MKPTRRSLWQWLKDQISQDVPPEDQLCAFDCHKLECAEDEWQPCERRLQRAAGELWPGPPGEENQA